MGKNGPFLGRFPKSYGLGFEIISVHTRADAIADGVLRDVSDTAKERGFRIPFAVTDTIWAEWIEASPGFQKYGQSVIPVFLKIVNSVQGSGTTDITCDWILGKFEASTEDLAEIYENSLPFPLRELLAEK